MDSRMNELEIVQRLATIEEHIKATNGTESRIEVTLAGLDAKVDGLAEDLANWKGKVAIVLIGAAALISGGVSLLVSFLR